MESSRLKKKSNKPQIPPTNLSKSSRISQIPQTSHKSLTNSQVQKPVKNSPVQKPVTNLTNSLASQNAFTNLTNSSGISQIPQAIQKSLLSSQISQNPQQAQKPVKNLPNSQTSQDSFKNLANMSKQVSQVHKPVTNSQTSQNAFTRLANMSTQVSQVHKPVTNSQTSQNAFTSLANMSTQVSQVHKHVTNSQTSQNAFTSLANMSTQGGRRIDVGRGVREDQDEEDNEEGGDEGDEEEIMGDGTTFERAERSICDGDYKKKPKDGKPKLGVVTFINKKNIKEPHYKKTLKAIVRTRWDFDTAKQKKRARETFLNECIEEFKEFYEYPPEYSGDKIKELEGDAVVKQYLKNNLRYYMNGWKTDGWNRVEAAHAKGDTSANLRSCPPYYLSEPAWDGLVDYWETEEFAKKSEVGRENVKKAEIKHCSGAKPFDHRYEELEEKTSKPLTLLEKFDVSYKKKGQVEEIGRKLKDVVERTAQEELTQDAPPSLVNQRKREVELLLEVCPPKKGKLLMFPRHTLPELIGRDEASKWTTSQSTLACIPERIPNSAYSIIGKVMTEVTTMVEALDEIEVTRARLEEEVQKLATRAYPNKDDPASKILWEEYIRIAAQMTSPLFERCKKVIIEDTRSDQMVLHENVDDVDLEDLQTRYPL